MNPKKQMPEKQAPEKQASKNPAPEKQISKITRAFKKKMRFVTEKAQTTAEYALVLLAAATLAVLLLTWAGQTNRIGKLFDTVLRSVEKLIT